jgi:hypothetical protein
VGKQLSAEQQQRRTQTLAAPGAQVLAYFGDGAHARNRVASELALDGGQVIAQKLENFFRAGCGW